MNEGMKLGRLCFLSITSGVSWYSVYVISSLLSLFFIRAIQDTVISPYVRLFAKS